MDEIFVTYCSAAGAQFGDDALDLQGVPQITLSAQRWQSEQVSHVHLEQDTEIDRVRNVAARRGVVHLVGMGHEPEEWLQRHAGRDGDAVVHLVGDLRRTCLTPVESI